MEKANTSHSQSHLHGESVSVSGNATSAQRSGNDGRAGLRKKSQTCLFTAQPHVSLEVEGEDEKLSKEGKIQAESHHICQNEVALFKEREGKDRLGVPFFVEDKCQCCKNGNR